MDKEVDNSNLPKLNIAADPFIIQNGAEACIGKCIESSQGCKYKITGNLQSAIYGGVFQGEAIRPPRTSNEVRAGDKVAIKIMIRAIEKKHRAGVQNNKKGNKNDPVEDIRAELKFANDMAGHKNLLSYVETWSDEDAIYIIMPFAEYEDLFEVMRKRKVPFTERECRWLFRQILEGAHYLHVRGLAFRDYSIENILLFRDPLTGEVYPRITDPGQAIRVEYNSRGDVKGQMAEKLFGKSFRPPEIYVKRPYNPIKVDTFCLGWMLFYCLTKKQIFDRAVDSDQNWSLLAEGRLRELLAHHGASHISITVCDLIIRMLHPDFERYRYTPKQALGHPWFKGVHIHIDDRTIYAQYPITTERLVAHPLAVTNADELRQRREREKERERKNQDRWSIT